MRTGQGLQGFLQTHLLNVRHRAPCPAPKPISLPTRANKHNWSQEQRTDLGDVVVCQKAEVTRRRVSAKTHGMT